MNISPLHTGLPRKLEPENDESGEVTHAVSRIVEPHSRALNVVKERKLVHYDQAARLQADAFREIRTRLLALGGDRNFITLVAPVSPRCGGSFVACNLAAAFAFHDAKKALLVDCDLGHPAQEDNLGIEAIQGGLTDYLERRQPGIERVTYRTRIPDLQLIPIGKDYGGSAERFSSTRMRELLDTLLQEDPGRYILLDAPPVSTSPDARILSDLADFVVLVAGSGKDTANDIEKAASNFDSDKFAGIVFNQLP